MVRLDMLIFGYYEIYIEPQYLYKASDLFLKNGISLSINPSGKILIPARIFKSVKTILEGKIEFKASQMKGLCGFLNKNKKRLGALIALITVCILIVISGDTVWDVRIDGAPAEIADNIIDELSKAGLTVGKRWSALDLSKIEAETLRSSESAAWLNINRRGSVAYVVVKEKIIHTPKPSPEGYASIVAERDCIIEEIIGRSGYAVVKKGESVSKGDVLISGVIPSELGGGFCYADGEVTGVYTDEVEVFVGKEKSEKRYGEQKLVTSTVNFFGFDINIFKNYGQSQSEYDIIKEKKDLSLGKKLPISITRVYNVPFEVVTLPLTEKETVELASIRLREELSAFLSDKEARKIKTSAEFTEDGYRMVCEIVACADVAKKTEFKVAE